MGLTFNTGLLSDAIKVSSTLNVGIGTSSPSDILDVQKNQNATTNFYLRNTNTTDSNSRAYLNLISGATSLVFKAINGDHSYIDATSNLYFQSAGSVKMTMLSSGNVGIGTSSPSSYSGYSVLSVNGSNGGLIETMQNGTQAIRIACSSTDSALWEPRNVPVLFGTNSTERMRITSSGVLQLGNGSYSPYFKFKTGGSTAYAGVINTDSTVDYIQINGGDSTGYGSGASVSFIGSNRYGTATAGQLELAGGNASNQTSYGYIAFSTANVLRMQISFNGAIGTTAGGTNIYNPSDFRLKKNIVVSPYGLNEILLLNPSKFNWRDGFSESEKDKDMLGFIAQEVQEVIPEAVESFGGDVKVKTEEYDFSVENPLRVNEKFIIPVLVKAIQEQQAQIEELKALINK